MKYSLVLAVLGLFLGLISVSHADTFYTPLIGVNYAAEKMSWADVLLAASKGLQEPSTNVGTSLLNMGTSMKNARQQQVARNKAEKMEREAIARQERLIRALESLSANRPATQ